MVRHVQDRCSVSERRACKALGVARSTQRYQGRGDNEGRASMRARLISTIVDDLEALVGMTRLCLASVLANSSRRLRSNASSRFRRGLLHPRPVRTWFALRFWTCETQPKVGPVVLLVQDHIMIEKESLISTPHQHVALPTREQAACYQMVSKVARIHPGITRF